ncbi:MAG: cell division protein FtsI (penicillin-binding protein 3) [Candidatus Tokpelaia sp. JSC188]|nr:MAG: cell division protein FtsI (penicillin-binding protein 3) [Candidatus Tokpelaia sp. JSC188]
MKFVDCLFRKRERSLSQFERVQEEIFLVRRIRLRFFIVIACFFGIYLVISIRLIHYGQQGGEIEAANGPAQPSMVSRPDLVDRNGQLLAIDIKTYSLFAEPYRIIDVNETVGLLSKVLPNLNRDESWRRLKSKSGFAWIQRGLTPRQKAKIMTLGIPGIGFRTETRRFYPGGPVASHILGLVNIDNQGIAGMEKYIDQAGLSDLRAAGLATPSSLEPVVLSIDIRVQTIVRDELQQAIQRYQALAAGAVVLNVKSGEILAMVSLPDFNPNTPLDVLKNDRLNRITAGTFEMGSTIKSFTTAMALDSGLFQLNTMIDASKPLRFGQKMISDFHGKYRKLALWEVFVYSSNIGSGREAEVIGIARHREFLKRLGLLERMTIELPEIAKPVEPHQWKKINSMTIAFGHGMMTTPLQTAVGAAALMNGGLLVKPTFLKRERVETLKHAIRIIKKETSRDMRYLYKLNADIGSGQQAVVKGYRVGGKTGTAEKVVDGRYSKHKRFNTFIGAFPMEDPSYVILTFIDEPKPEAGAYYATAAFNAAPIVANIIRRSASFLGVVPDFDQESRPIQAIAVVGE